MGWKWDAVRGDPRGVVLDLGDCFLSSLQSTQHISLAKMNRRIRVFCWRCSWSWLEGCPPLDRQLSSTGIVCTLEGDALGSCAGNLDRGAKLLSWTVRHSRGGSFSSGRPRGSLRPTGIAKVSATFSHRDSANRQCRQFVNGVAPDSRWESSAHTAAKWRVSARFRQTSGIPSLSSHMVLLVPTPPACVPGRSHARGVE